MFMFIRNLLLEKGVNINIEGNKNNFCYLQYPIAKLFDSEMIHYVIYKQYNRLIVSENHEAKYSILTNWFEFDYTIKDLAVRIQV